MAYIIAAVIFVLAGFVFFLRAQQPNLGNHKLKIIAAENMWANIVAQIGGDKVDVTAIITDPTADPHLYESTVKDAANVATADIVIANGLGYDDFINKLLATSTNQNRTVITVADVLGTKSGDNPHLWYDIPHINTVAAAIQKILSAKESSEDAAFQGNLLSFTQSLQPLQAVLDDIRRNYAGAPVAYTERVAGYILGAAGLDVLTPPSFAAAIEDGNEPSPIDQSTMQGLITNNRIRILLYNPQANSPVTDRLRQVASQHNVPVVAVTETLPAQATYQNWQKEQLDAIRAALDNTK